MTDHNPYDAIGANTWKKGMLLGMGLLVLFTLGAVAIFCLSSVVGFNWENSLLMAAILGPFIGTGGFIVWWLVKKPRLNEPPQ